MLGKTIIIKMYLHEENTFFKENHAVYKTAWSIF